MWVNLRGLRDALDERSIDGMRPALSALNGLRMRGEPVQDSCIPIGEMGTCYGSNGNITCAGRTWHWWSDSSARCARAASLVGIEACCYGWSDLLFLPSHAHAEFRALAEPFRDVFHEVAIPTILHHMHSTESQRSGTIATPASLPLPWLRLPCHGSCCSTVDSWANGARPSLCAHKVRLQALAEYDWIGWGINDGVSSRIDPYPGYYQCHTEVAQVPMGQLPTNPRRARRAHDG
jgi:hypothetical protein